MGNFKKIIGIVLLCFGAYAFIQFQAIFWLILAVLGLGLVLEEYIELTTTIGIILIIFGVSAFIQFQAIFWLIISIVGLFLVLKNYIELPSSSNKKIGIKNPKETKQNKKTKQNKQVVYSQINFVDLYETRAVRGSTARGYRMNNITVYKAESSSNQEWTNLGRGTLTLAGDKLYFVGGGQQRTLDRKKIIDIHYFSDDPGIELSVSNRNKSMRFLLPGRTIADGERLFNAIVKGETSVVLTELTSNPGGCYVATFVYGGYNTQEVLILRKFRDEKLLTNYPGKLFVKIYYKTSPLLIKHFGGNLFKKTTKQILDSIIKKIN